MASLIIFSSNDLQYRHSWSCLDISGHLCSYSVAQVTYKRVRKVGDRPWCWVDIKEEEKSWSFMCSAAKIDMIQLIIDLVWALRSVCKVLIVLGRIKNNDVLIFCWLFSIWWLGKSPCMKKLGDIRGKMAMFLIRCRFVDLPSVSVWIGWIVVLSNS